MRFFLIHNFRIFIQILFFICVVIVLLNFVSIDMILAEEVTKSKLPIKTFLRNIRKFVLTVMNANICVNCGEPPKLPELPGVVYTIFGTSLFFFPEFYLFFIILILLFLNLFFRKYNFSYDIVNLNIYLTLLGILFTIYLLNINIPFDIYIFNYSFIINN